MSGTRQGFHHFLLYILCKLGAICPQAHESGVQWVFWSMTKCIFQGQQSHQIKLNISVPVLMGERSFGISLLTAFNQSIHRARWTLSLTKNYLDCSMTFPVGLHLSLSVLINSLMVSLISASICIWICIIWTENVMIYNCSPSSLLTLGKAPATLST